MTGGVNATPAGGRAEVLLTVVLDPNEPAIGAGPAVYADLLNRPVLAITSLDAVDPSRVGEVVIGLLQAAVLGQEPPKDSGRPG